MAWSRNDLNFLHLEDELVDAHMITYHLLTTAKSDVSPLTDGRVSSTLEVDKADGVDFGRDDESQSLRMF